MTKYTPARRALLLVALLVIPLPTYSHDAVSDRGEPKAKTSTARGIVFEDANGNQIRDEGEPGIGGIGVSNGSMIVETDQDGRYELPVDDDEAIFVIKPRNYTTPLGKNNLPKFFYIHKPAGSPEDLRFPGVTPTGPLPDSIDFPLQRRAEPQKFKAIMFGDPQPRNLKEVEYIAHDVIEQVVEHDAHGAAFGVTLGDIVFDDLSVMEPLNQAIALIGIPWYNVIGNHDLNQVARHDEQSDETFERIYGPTYYSFDYGPAHFLVLDDVQWFGAHGDQRGHYHGGLGRQQMEFIRNDLARIPEDQLVVLMMHIPLTDVDDRQELYRLIEERPATVSISAHTHYMEHRYIDQDDGWQGMQPHHHIVNVTVSGSWFRGRPDERGIPHTTMSDGGPNGYSVMEFDGADYSLDVFPARRPASYQMNIYTPESVSAKDLATTAVLVNVFNGSDDTQVEMRLDREGDWIPMSRVTALDPAFVSERSRDRSVNDRDWQDLPRPHPTPHMWRALLPTGLRQGTHLIEVRASGRQGKVHHGRRILRVVVTPDEVSRG